MRLQRLQKTDRQTNKVISKLRKWHKSVYDILSACFRHQLTGWSNKFGTLYNSSASPNLFWALEQNVIQSSLEVRSSGLFCVYKTCWFTLYCKTLLLMSSSNNSHDKTIGNCLCQRKDGMVNVSNLTSPFTHQLHCLKRLEKVSYILLTATSMTIAVL